MFSNLRQGSQLYLLHKKSSTPYLEMGCVETTSNLMTGYYPTITAMPINISVRVGDRTTPYQNLPPNAEVADVTNNSTGETVTIACTKEAVNAEICNMKQESVDAINSVEWHRQRIGVCETLQQQLNPEQAEKARREQEMTSMKNEMQEMRRQMAEQAEINKMLLAQLKGEKASSKQTKKEE